MGFSGNKQITRIDENSITYRIKHSEICNYLPTFSTSSLVYWLLFDYNTGVYIDVYQCRKVDEHAATTTNNTSCGRYCARHERRPLCDRRTAGHRWLRSCLSGEKPE